MTMELEEYYAQIEAEALEECDQYNPVVREITYRRFVSRSKGRRNGKQRQRSKREEVHLIKYRDVGFHTWRNFPFDVYATEILGQHADGDTLRDEIEKRWGF